MPIAKSYTNLWIKHVAMAIMLLLVAPVAKGQNNPYKISDKLYPMYVKAFNLRKQKAALAVSDTLYRRAVALNDKKAQCLALSIPFLYAFYNENTVERLDPPLKRMQDAALHTGYLQYYYYGVSNKVIFYINHSLYAEAVEYIEQQQKFAFRHNHKYGIYVGYRMLGMIHQHKFEYLQAIENFKEAADYCQNYLPDQDVAMNYRSIAECYRLLDDAGKIYETAEKGLKVVKSEQVKQGLLIYRAYAEFLMGNDMKFAEDYALLKKGKQQLKNSSSPSMNYLLQLFNDFLNGKDVSIVDDLPKTVSEEEKLMARMVYYKRKNDYKMAMQYQRELYWMREEAKRMSFRKDMANMNVRLNNQQLIAEKRRVEYQNTKLELDNTQLTLQNSSLELGRTKTAEHLARLSADRNLLYFNNQKLVSKQLRDSLEGQRIKRFAREKELKLHHTVALLLVAATFIVFLLSLVYIYYSRRISRKLKLSNKHLVQMNKQLIVASDRAKQSDRMKTMFVQNMSHEIRTPLNAIVGFSQLLVNSGDEFSDEDKVEMAKNISDSSELLSTLVNDILDMTALESGKYVMKIDRCNVTDLCNLAVKTVMHRKAPGVELSFHSSLPDNFIVDTDMQRVLQVLINMLTNAEKNTTEGSIVLSVATDEKNQNLLFSVADTGIGIPKDKMDEIFERFKKLDNFKQGSGLGLNICRMIAERLGGTIDIDRDYTGGARFVFSLPLK